MAPGQALPPHGKQLGRLHSADLKQVIQKVHSEELLSGMLFVWSGLLDIEYAHIQMCLQTVQ